MANGRMLRKARPRTRNEMMVIKRGAWPMPSAGGGGGGGDGGDGGGEGEGDGAIHRGL